MITSNHFGLLKSQLSDENGKISNQPLRHKLFFRETKSIKALVSKLDRSNISNPNAPWSEASTKLIDYYSNPWLRRNQFKSAFFALCAMRRKTEKSIRSWISNSREGMQPEQRSIDFINFFKFDFELALNDVPTLRTGPKSNFLNRSNEAYEFYLTNNLDKLVSKLKKECQNWDNEQDYETKSLIVETIFSCITVQQENLFESEISTNPDIRVFFDPIIQRNQICENPNKIETGRVRETISEEAEDPKRVEAAPENMDPVEQELKEVVRLENQDANVLDSHFSKYVVCRGLSPFGLSPSQGFLSPLFFRTEDGLTEARPGQFPSKGSIFVTKGYEEVESNKGCLFEVAVSEARNWDKAAGNTHIARWTTYNGADVWKKLSSRDLSICSVINGDYPVQNAPLRIISSMIPTQDFFLLADNQNEVKTLIGPLTLAGFKELPARDGEELFVIDYLPPNRPFADPWNDLNVAPHATCEIPFSALDDDNFLEDSGGNLYVFLSALDLPERRLLDLSNEQQLLKWFNKLARQSTRPESADIASKIKSAVKFFSETGIEAVLPPQIVQQRLGKLKHLTDKIAESADFAEPLANFMSSEEGGKHVEQVLLKNLDHYISLYVSDAETGLNRKLEKLQSELDEKNTELSQLNSEIASKRSKAFNKVEIEAAKAKFDELTEKLSLPKDIENLRIQKALEEAHIDELKNTEISLTQTLEEIEAKMLQSVSSRRKSLIELKLDLDILEGKRYLAPSQTIQPPQAQLFQSLADDNIASQRTEVINLVSARLEDESYEVELDLLTQLLISFCQNLIVTIAGSPGSGKTSLVTNLSKALGLAAANKHVHIQVQRGWTTDNDILGFQNNLTNTYSPDRFGLYELIKRLQNADSDGSLSIVTLDEANLSPIEYYFSNFMGCFDDKSRFISQGEKLHLPDGLRFLATINYDQTTESLSERFLDRSPIFNLDYLTDRSSFSFQAQTDEQPLSEFRLTDFYRLFQPSIESSEELLENEDSDFLKMLSTDYGTVFKLERRKWGAISRFINVLKPIYASRERAREKALDDAALLFILPKIRGQGKSYRDQLTEAADRFLQNNCVKSASVIRKIVQKGQFDAYDFFS